MGANANDIYLLKNGGLVMRKKLNAAVFLVTGLSVLILSDLGGNLISQASAKSKAEAQKKAAKSQVVEASLNEQEKKDLGPSCVL